MRIQNFRCLQDVELTLGPLTALVGANASGKSTMLQALTLPSNVPRRSLEFADGPALTNPRNEPLVQLRQQQLEQQYRSLLLHLDLDRLRSGNKVQRATILKSDGSNLANVFDTLTRKQQALLAQELCRLVPVLADVDVGPMQGITGQHQLRFQDRWNPQAWYQPNEVSDGTILLTAYLTLAYAQQPPHLLAIEEPERGLHPFLLSELVEFLRGLATGQIGSQPIQIVLATHSAELLDVLKPEEVRFLSRDPKDGSVRVETAPVDAPGWEEAFQQYRESLGSAWLSGGLGGVPGA
ncbi:MAG TPA: AAA family ATPase [Polyangia bacterium]|nr:AAA family ATPase [Polyangia bacterium]